MADWLRWRMGAPGEGELACVTLAASPEDVARAVATSADVRGTDDPVVLASLWWQGYAYSVGGTALACWLLTGVAPDVRAERMAVGIARGRPSSVVYGSTETTADPSELSDWLFAGHLDPVASSLGEPAAGVRARVETSLRPVPPGRAVREAAGDPWHDGLAAFLAAAPHDPPPRCPGVGAPRPRAYHRGPAACGGRRPHPAGAVLRLLAPPRRHRGNPEAR